RCPGHCTPSRDRGSTTMAQRCMRGESARPDWGQEPKIMTRHFGANALAVLICLFAILTRSSFPQSSEILGEVELVGASKVEKTSGVWIDGQYVGYLKELKGAKKILLLPGEHDITVRQDGYHDFTDKITVRPGEKQTISVKMIKDPSFKMPSVFSEI